MSNRSQDLFERAVQLMPGGVNSPVRAFRSVGGSPFFVERADGPYLFTADGVRLTDFVCTWGPAIHGHNPSAIREAVHEALQKGTSFGTPNPYEVEMAETIVGSIPSVEKIRMCNSGTEATMSCIRLARGFTKRDKVIKFAGCYHGHVDSLLIKAGSGALTHGQPDSAGIPKSFAAETVVLPYNDIAAVDAAFAANPGSIAAIIVEPYPANIGLLLPGPGYLRKLRDLCTANGTVLIFDEVMTGFRVALGGVQEKENVTPDLTALGKIIGGGLPVGAFGGRREIMDHLSPEGPVYQAGTLSGNPLAMAAGLAALRLLRDERPYQKLEELGRGLAAAIRAACGRKGLPVQVPQVGSMFSIFFAENPVRNYNDAVAGDAGLFRRFFHLCLKKNVYLPPSAFETCFISTAHSGEAIEQAEEAFTDAIGEL